MNQTAESEAAREETLKQIHEMLINNQYTMYFLKLFPPRVETKIPFSFLRNAKKRKFARFSEISFCESFRENFRFRESFRENFRFRQCFCKYFCILEAFRHNRNFFK
jgi:hypothetical protein